MPKYNFQCSVCEKVEQKYTSSTTTEQTCSCGNTSLRQLPNLGGPAELREVVNNMTNTVWKDGQKEMLKERKSDYFWEIEVPKMVRSGIYTPETMLDNGWVYIDEKGNIQIHTKPPEKR